MSKKTGGSKVDEKNLEFVKTYREFIRYGVSKGAHYPQDMCPRSEECEECPRLQECSTELKEYFEKLDGDKCF